MLFRGNAVLPGGLLRTLVFIVAVAWSICGLSDPAAAQSLPRPLEHRNLPATADAYRIVFDQWVARRKPESAILAVRRDGRTISANGHNVDPLNPTLIASLSKPITGACIATLIRDGKLSFTTPLRDVLGQFFKQFGAPADERLNNVMVEELLVHRGGLRGNADEDPIFAVFARRAHGGAGILAEAKPVLAEYMMRERLVRHPGGRYSYSNTGYEILTAIIEEQSGRSYEDYCGEAVFGKLGLDKPQLHSEWQMLSGAGGWFVPGPDYLKFLDIFDPAHPFLSDEVKQWIDRAQTRWTPGHRGRWYSLGINTWAGQGRWAVSHGGIMNVRGRDSAGRAISGQIVSHAFRAANGTAVFMAVPWTRDAQESLDDLRRAIGETHKYVKIGP
jgi:CubicO group peptidase (beta-lactamase class C family)